MKVPLYEDVAVWKIKELKNKELKSWDARAFFAEKDAYVLTSIPHRNILWKTNIFTFQIFKFFNVV